MRKSLKLSKHVTINIADEIEITKNYISLEMLRFPEGLSINIKNNLSHFNHEVPPLIIQPFIENAIKHGIMPSRNKHGVIDITIYEKNNQLYISISDNGIGFLKPLNFDDGDGMRISKERLELLSPNSEIYLDNTKENTTIVLKIIQ